MVRFLTSNLFDDNELLLPCIVAACDQHHTYASRCLSIMPPHLVHVSTIHDNDTLLLFVCLIPVSVVALGQDALKNLRRLDLEDSALVTQLMTAWLGDIKPSSSSASSSSASPAPAPAAQRRAVGESVRVRILSYLGRSERAANSFPATLRLLFDCLFAAAEVSTPRLQAAGLAFAHWVFARARTTDQLTLPMAKLLFPQLLKALVTAIKEANAPSEPQPRAATLLGASSIFPPTSAPAAPPAHVQQQQAQMRVQIRSALFTSLAQLVSRQPGLLQGNTCVQLAKLYFAQLAQVLGNGAESSSSSSSSSSDANDTVRQGT